MPLQHLALQIHVNTVVSCPWWSDAAQVVAFHLQYMMLWTLSQPALGRHYSFSGSARNNAKEYLSIQRYSKYLFGHWRPGRLRPQTKHQVQLWSITLMLCRTDGETALKLVERMSPGWFGTCRKLRDAQRRNIPRVALLVRVNLSLVRAGHTTWSISLDWTRAIGRPCLLGWSTEKLSTQNRISMFCWRPNQILHFPSVQNIRIISHPWPDTCNVLCQLVLIFAANGSDFGMGPQGPHVFSLIPTSNSLAKNQSTPPLIEARRVCPPEVLHSPAWWWKRLCSSPWNHARTLPKIVGRSFVAVVDHN